MSWIDSTTSHTWLPKIRHSSTPNNDLSIENKQLTKTLADKDLEISMLKELLKKPLPSIWVKMQVAKYFIDQDSSVNKILKFAEISSSNWYYYCKLKTADQRKLNKGRPSCSNKAINIVGEIVDNNFIVEALKKYRQQKFLSIGGRYCF